MKLVFDQNCFNLFDNIQKRKYQLLFRSREVAAAADPLADEEPDVWYSTSKLFVDHINEVTVVIIS